MNTTRLSSTVLAALISVASSAAWAGDYQIAGLARTNMTYQTSGAVSAARTNAYNGVGTIFVNTVSTGQDHGFLCTASLINSYTVLSAAHCIYDHDENTGALDPVTRIQFFLPSFGERATAGTEVYTASSFAYNPLYNDASNPGFGDIGSGYDTSVITLDRMATGHDTYSLYTGNSPLGQYLEVGTGSVGGPNGTAIGTPDFEKRTGSNLFELYGDDVFTDVSHGVVLSDFDDGTAAHDVFGYLATNFPTEFSSSLKQTGVAGEADSSPGDSGGPEFNAAGQIVSVTSFGITGAIFQGYCGTNAAHPTALDPYHENAAGTAIVNTYTTNLNLCTNSSVGEIAGDTLVSYNTGFINNYLATHPFAGGVPEPATWAMMLMGFAAAGSVMRRRPAVPFART